MKLSTLLLIAVLALAAAIVPALQLDAKRTHLRQLQEQPNDPPHPEQSEQTGMPGDVSDGVGGDMDDDNDYGYDADMYENVRCFPGSWNWPRCRFGGGKCFPGSWNWPRCRFGGGGSGCFPGSWKWPRCRHWL
ncbi:unnamed protein product [Peronospora belbahrii]|uniref:Uncharacterized protein n=1 Tax=Peronospora belbahrii TaxID=622444 RepID=A0ABN8DFQ8_9STRA|nr:unnamed protein product [Peronospora belbahrii]